MINSVRMISHLVFALAIGTVAMPTVVRASTNQCFTDLTQPYIHQAALLTWANEAAVAAYTFNFVNYNTQFKSISNYFTPEGWKAFHDKLTQSDIFKSMIDKKLLVTAVTTKAPIILKQEVVNGHYSWRVQMPLLVTYQSPTEFTHENLMVTMLIERTAPYEGIKGIGVVELMAEQVKDKK